MAPDKILNKIDEMIEKTGGKLDTVEETLKPEDYAVPNNISEYHRLTGMLQALSILKGVMKK